MTDRNATQVNEGPKGHPADTPIAGAVALTVPEVGERVFDADVLAQPGVSRSGLLLLAPKSSAAVS